MRTSQRCNHENPEKSVSSLYAKLSWRHSPELLPGDADRSQGVFFGFSRLGEKRNEITFLIVEADIADSNSLNEEQQ